MLSLCRCSRIPNLRFCLPLIVAHALARSFRLTTSTLCTGDWIRCHYFAFGLHELRISRAPSASDEDPDHHSLNNSLDNLFLFRVCLNRYFFENFLFSVFKKSDSPQRSDAASGSSHCPTFPKYHCPFRLFVWSPSSFDWNGFWVANRLGSRNFLQGGGETWSRGNSSLGTFIWACDSVWYSKVRLMFSSDVLTILQDFSTSSTATWQTKAQEI